jgi:hypothetical protein
MKQIKLITLLCLIFSLTQSFAVDTRKNDAKFIKKIQKAFQNHNSESLVSLTLWTGISEKEKKSAIKKYKREITLNMTRIEFKDAKPKDWKNWKSKDVEYTYNLPVSKEIIVHLEKGSKIKLSFGEIPIKDIKLPVGKKDGKWYLLKSIKVTKEQQV